MLDTFSKLATPPPLPHLGIYAEFYPKPLDIFQSVFSSHKSIFSKIEVHFSEFSFFKGVFKLYSLFLIFQNIFFLISCSV